MGAGDGLLGCYAQKPADVKCPVESISLCRAVPMAMAILVGLARQLKDALSLRCEADIHPDMDLTDVSKYLSFARQHLHSRPSERARRTACALIGTSLSSNSMARG